MPCSRTPCIIEGFIDKEYEDVIYELHFGIQEELLQCLWNLSMFMESFNGTEISLVEKSLVHVIKKLLWIRSMNEIFLNSTRGQTLKEFNELMVSKAKKYVNKYVTYF